MRTQEERNSLREQEGTAVHLKDLLSFEKADDLVEKWSSLDETLQESPSSSNFELPTQIEGSEEFKTRIRLILERYKDVFRTTVASEAANVPPMVLDVDENKWKCARQNKAPLRYKSGSKDEEIRRQCKKMLDLDIIERTEQSESWSQVHLVAKPTVDNKATWRFCCDMRFLNECTSTKGGVIPNIKHTLERIGRRKPTLFGVLDLTSGYHQAPLAEVSRVYTAFITSMGIFQWKRVVMGLKGAPAYFQAMIQPIVLPDMMYHSIEVYLDDLIAFAKDEEEYLDRLELLLKRLRDRRITVNPKKCRLGMSSIEYVGHVIDKEGLSYSPEKVKEVLDFPPPRIETVSRSFIGLANYFSNKVEIMQWRLAP